MTSAGDALKDYGYGFAGGLVFEIGRAVFGSGFVGGLLGAVLAGSVVKGTRGSTLATVLGFQSIVSGGSTQSQAVSSADPGVM